MTKTLAVYHNSVPNNKNPEKVDVLRHFSQGVRAVGDTVIDIQDKGYPEADVAVIQGWVTEEVGRRPHLELRNRVIRDQLKRGRHVVGIDSNLFLYADKENPHHYLRYSFDSVFPDQGIYCDTDPDPVRWQKISRDHGISLRDYRSSGNHILLCLQRNGGWSMGGFDVVDWAMINIALLRKYTDRSIRIRAHPGDKNRQQHCAQILQNCTQRKISGIEISREELLTRDLKHCWAVVNHNSSPVVGAAIEGYPIFVTDPAKSQCRDIANTNFAAIENPGLPDRQRWVERISMFHWKFDELRSGEAWSHMRQWI